MFRYVKFIKGFMPLTVSVLMRLLCQCIAAYLFELDLR